MFKRTAIAAVALLITLAPGVYAQLTPWYRWTLLPPEIMDEIIGEASGETAWNTVLATGGYNRDRQPEEYAGTFYESQYVFDQLVSYGVPGAEIARFPGGEVWDGIKGELWEVAPLRQKLASFQDMRAMLASGSNNADVTAQLVWVGRGTADEIDRANVDGKIVVTEGSTGAVHQLACLERGALGVVAIGNSRPHFDPLQIPWSRIGSRRGGDQTANKFGFLIPPREAADLKRRLLAGHEITVHAQVETTTQPYDLQDPVAYIPGTDPNADEIILTAHLFEGYVKQGANDNKSGSACVLEVARTLHTLIDQGRIPRPKRTIRFLWGPEFSGTGPWVVANKDIMERTLANINMDMVGEWLSLSKAYFTVMRTTYGNPHYINDVMENYFRYVGESNRERPQNRREFYKIPRRIVAPTGADEPFYYSIETHYGSSDHMIFNDWGVGVPGVIMNGYPDQWYHTSGDRIDKSDPTQLKRAAIIGAAGAYTVALADDELAVRIAGETVSNGTRRLGHQLVMGLERLNGTTPETLAESYRWARAHVEGSVINEKATLETVLQLATDEGRVGDHVRGMQETIDQIGEAHLSALETHMETIAAQIGIDPVRVRLTSLERDASRLVPRPTPLVKQDGYGGWRPHLQSVMAEGRRQFPYETSDIANTGELNLLINGRNSVLDIKKMLDAQYKTASDLQAIINYIEILKLAGLVEM